MWGERGGEGGASPRLTQAPPAGAVEIRACSPPSPLPCTGAKGKGS